MGITNFHKPPLIRGQDNCPRVGVGVRLTVSGGGGKFPSEQLPQNLLIHILKKIVRYYDHLEIC